MKNNSPIFIAGENTMAGKALIKELIKSEYNNIINIHSPEPELTNFFNLDEYFRLHKPKYVFLFGGKSGGIKANEEMPASLMIDNLKVISNVVELSHKNKVEKLLYMSSCCIYPKLAKQPMEPSMLMQGALEPTNVAYATAKLSGVHLCSAYKKQYNKNFISAIPANIFGPGDSFDLANSHVMAGLIVKMVKAKNNNDKSVQIWGTGSPKREFIFVDDLANACIFIMKNYSGEAPINIGSGYALSIFELANTIKEAVGFSGDLKFDTSKPDGMPEKSLDSSELFSIGWEPFFSFQNALEKTINWFYSNINSAGKLKE